jgi:hypothetical protein
MEGEGRRRPDPPSLSLFLSASCRPAWPRQHQPTAPRRHDQAPPAREQGCRARHHRCTSPGPPCAGHPLDALAPDSLAYKNPCRAHEWTHTIPNSLPDTLSSPRSLSFDEAYNAGELLGAGSAAAFGRRWTNGSRELEEECRRSLFCPSLSSPASSTRVAIAVIFLAVRRWAPALAVNTTQQRRWIRIQRQHTDSAR